MKLQVFFMLPHCGDPVALPGLPGFPPVVDLPGFPPAMVARPPLPAVSLPPTDLIKLNSCFFFSKHFDLI